MYVSTSTCVTKDGNPTFRQDERRGKRPQSNIEEIGMEEGGWMQEEMKLRYQKEATGQQLATL